MGYFMTSGDLIREEILCSMIKQSRKIPQPLSDSSMGKSSNSGPTFDDKAIHFGGPYILTPVMG